MMALIRQAARLFCRSGGGCERACGTGPFSPYARVAPSGAPTKGGYGSVVPCRSGGSRDRILPHGAYFPHRRSRLPTLLQRVLVALGLATGLASPVLADTLTVQVSGRVAHSGAQTLAEGSRLSDAVLAADVLPGAYPLGAAWLRAGLRETQTRWKAGLLYEVGLLRGQAKLDGDMPLNALASQLEQRWRAMPVTGRQRETLLDPRPLEISDRNHLLANGDRMLYPSRPTTVRVLGAVAQPCTLPFVGMQAPRRYLQDCPRDAAADPDWLYLIQPDGHVERRGVALWNRQPTQPLAPGAVLYVPLKPRALPASVREDFNDDAARFLSTQPLPADMAQGDRP